VSIMTIEFPLSAFLITRSGFFASFWISFRSSLLMLGGVLSFLRFNCPRCEAEYKRKDDLADHAAEQHSTFLIWKKSTVGHFNYVKNVILLDGQGIILEGPNPRYRQVVPKQRKEKKTYVNAWTNTSETDLITGEPENPSSTEVGDVIKSGLNTTKKIPKKKLTIMLAAKARADETAAAWLQPSTSKASREDMTTQVDLTTETSATATETVQNDPDPAPQEGIKSNNEIESYTTIKEGKKPPKNTPKKTSKAEASTSKDPTERKRTCPRKPGGSAKKPKTAPTTTPTPAEEVETPKYLQKLVKKIGTLQELLAPRTPGSLIRTESMTQAELDQRPTKTADAVKQAEIDLDTLLEDLATSPNTSSEDGH
jgi:hypothetical protein